MQIPVQSPTHNISPNTFLLSSLKICGDIKDINQRIAIHAVFVKKWVHIEP